MNSDTAPNTALPRRRLTFRARGKRLELGRRTALMGVINVTPDSFFRDSRRLEPGQAVDAALAMVEAGADIIDIGGESTRPGAPGVSVDEELRRISPVISKLRRQTGACISIDTRRSRTAREALDLGADLVNDVSALGDRHMADRVARANAGLILMHMKGTPQTMQHNPDYQDLIAEIREFLSHAVQSAEASGVSPDSIIVDPGIGFGKTAEHSLQIVNRIGLFASIGKPILVGTSRKSFIGKVLDLPPEQRLLGTAATVVAAILRGAHLVRVHDTTEMVQVAKMADAIANETLAAPSVHHAVGAPQ